MNKSVIGLGTFDGVHRGHSQLISKVVEIAQEFNICPMVHVFKKHPLSVLTANEPSILSNFDEKLELMRGLGVKSFLIEDFTKEFSLNF